MRRLAIVASHPVQYQAPWFRALAARCDLTVFFCHKQDAAGQGLAGFGQAFEWDVPLLDGYRHEWLDNVSAAPGVDKFGGCDTPDIGRKLAAGHFDACVLNGWYLKSYLQALRACRAQGLPVMVRGDSQLGGPRPRLKAVLKHVPYRWMLRRFNAHLYVGQANLTYLRHFGVRPERLFFAPHCVDNERFATGADEARRSGAASRLRDAWGATAATTVFLYAGKLTTWKRPADFVEAVGVLARTGHDVRGVVVGSGPDEDALRARAAADGIPMVFDGFRNQTEMPARYAAGDGLIVPGRETWGLVVNEAMAVGVPAIVSDAVGCAPDLIDEGRTGATYPLGAVSALAERMAELAARRSTGPEMRTDVLERIARYTCAAAAEGTLGAVEAVARVIDDEPVAVMRGQRA
jgi:glycosyltransferase involved in cell wall biosynthesis